MKNKDQLFRQASSKILPKEPEKQLRVRVKAVGNSWSCARWWTRYWLRARRRRSRRKADRSFLRPDPEFFCFAGTNVPLISELLQCAASAVSSQTAETHLQQLFLSYRNVQIHQNFRQFDGRIFVENVESSKIARISEKSS